jgi:metal-responsive CopG/Arc/MetJ family transcriptional regulator
MKVKTRGITLVVSEELTKKIDEQAQKEMRNRSNFILNVVANYIKNIEQSEEEPIVVGTYPETK